MGNCLGYTTKTGLVHSSTSTSGTSNTTCTSTVSSLSTSSYGNKSEKLPLPISEGEILSSPNSKAFTYNDLKSSTKNFENQIGEGGFGIVYKGWMDINTLSPSKPGSGIVVAIKKLKPEGFQGHEEWLTEIKYLSQFHHPNLVKLIGYCLEGENRLLVYEFMPKGSLENHLIRRGIQPLSWATRIKIAMDAARGLSVLHNNESQVICRDVKSSNILLDGEFNAKLSDFGLAKAGPTGDRTHVSTRVMGTHGYAAPEYLATGRLTWKCDVYSFGVVLLELLTGRPAMERTKSGVEQSLVDWVKHYMNDNRKLLRIIDIKLEGQYPKKGAEMLAALASQCLSEDPKLRPRMTEVLIALEQIQGLKSMTKLGQHHQKTDLNHTHKSPLRYTPSPRRGTK